MDDRSERLKSKQVHISCVVPVYNEELLIENFIDEIKLYLYSLTSNFEVIFIDDGSCDKTFTKVQSKLDNNIKILKLSRNFGKEIALTAGIEHASGEVIILMDSDFQHPMQMIEAFLINWASGYDMVYGIRQNRERESTLKRILTKMFYFGMRCMTQVNIVPNAGDFRLLDKRVADSLISCEERGRFMKGLYSWVGFKSIGIPFKVADRAGGKSSFSFRRLAELAITGITSFSNTPLRVWSLFGLAIAVASFLYAVYLICKTIIHGADLPGYTSIMVAIFFFGGVQLCSIGVLGEYIAKIFNEVKRRPKYIIEQKLGF